MHVTPEGVRGGMRTAHVEDGVAMALFRRSVQRAGKRAAVGIRGELRRTVEVARGNAVHLFLVGASVTPCCEHRARRYVHIMASWRCDCRDDGDRIGGLRTALAGLSGATFSSTEQSA